MGNYLESINQKETISQKETINRIKEQGKSTDNFSFGSYKSTDKPRPGYFITKEKVYYRGREIDADAKTFVKLHKGHAKDKNGLWYKGIRVTKAKE